LDQKTITKIKRKHCAWQRNYETKREDHWREYTKLRNQVKSLIRKAHLNFEKDIAKAAKHNPKKLWSYVNSRTKTRSGVASLEIPGTEETTNEPSEQAEILSNYFCSVYTSEQDTNFQGLPATDNGTPQIADINITEDQVLKKLKCLKTDKSPGSDGIHPVILQKIAPVLAKPLYIIFSTSLRTATLPQEWKTAQVSAIYKKGPKKLAQNYRPISLTCIACKIIESIIRDTLMDHFYKNNLLSTRQYGFISGRSTCCTMECLCMTVCLV
jgi:hypothetical protein